MSSIYHKHENQPSIYTAAQKFPFKIAKQASTMNPDIISKSCTHTDSVTMPVHLVFYCKTDSRSSFISLFKCDVYFLLKLWSK